MIFCPLVDPRAAGQQSSSLLNVVDRWLQEVTPGAHLQFETITNADALIAGFSFDRRGDVRTRRYRGHECRLRLVVRATGIDGLAGISGHVMPD